MEEAAGALGAGVDALRDHEVHEAGLAAGGDERVVFVDGFLDGGRWRRGCGGEAGGVGCVFVFGGILVVAAAAAWGRAVLVGGPVVVVVVIVVVVAGAVAAGSASRVLGGPVSVLPVDVVNFSSLKWIEGVYIPDKNRKKEEKLIIDVKTQLWAFFIKRKTSQKCNVEDQEDLSFCSSTAQAQIAQSQSKQS